MINKNEKNSFFNYLDPFERVSAVNPYVCAGIKGSCEKFCLSYFPLSEIKELNFREWFFVSAQMDKTSSTKPNFLPRSMDMYAGDFPKETRDLFLKEELSKYPSSLFFVASKNPLAMMEESFCSSNIVWTDSVSSQEETDFLAYIYGLYSEGVVTHPRKALLISPLVEPITVPEILIDSIEYIVVDGYYGESSFPLHLEWIISLEKQAKEGNVHFILDGLGDSPLLYKEEKVKINQKKLYNVPIAEIIKKASPK